MSRVLPIVWGSPRRALLTCSISAVLLLAAVIALPQLMALAVPLLIGSPFVAITQTFPNETKQVVGRALGHLASASRHAERESVKQDLEGTLTLGAERARGAWPPGAAPSFKMDYLRTPEEVSRLPDGTLIIGIAMHEHRTRNLVAGAWAYVRHGVLPDARPFLDPDVSQGMDFVLTKSILNSAGLDAVSDFLKHIWTPAVLGRQRLRELTDKLQVIEDQQLLGPVVLSEFMDLAVRIGTRFPSDAIAEETARFVEYMYDLAQRAPGEEIGDLANFDGNVLRCKVIFVARPNLQSVKGPTSYRRAVDWAARRAYHSVYLLAAGRNLDYLEEVIQPLGSDSRIKAIHKFPGHRRNPSGRIVRQSVVRLCLDVRYLVGIGQRPLVAVGPGRGVDMAEARRGDKSAVS